MRCRLFCIIVCPPPDTIPLFTHVGAYHVDPIYGDFQPNGTTTAGGYAFTRTIPLDGILPDGTALDAVEYRFQIAKFPWAWDWFQNVVGAMVTATKIGQLQHLVLERQRLDARLLRLLGQQPGRDRDDPPAVRPAARRPGDHAGEAGGWIEVPRENNFVIGGGGKLRPQRRRNGRARHDSS